MIRFKMKRCGFSFRRQARVPPFPLIHPQIGFCWFEALPFKPPWKAPAVIIGRLSKVIAEVRRVAQVGVGANSRALEIPSA
jgi:hypothetical protein